NDQTNHRDSVPSDAAVRESGRGLISPVPSPQSKEDALASGEEASKARALQEFGSSHPRANEPGAAQSAGALRAPAAASSRTPPARKSRLWKASVVLFVI